MNDNRESTTAVIVTSLMPRRFDAQQAAVNSWLQLGFSVVSVNCLDEIDLLRHSFQGVEFVEASETDGSSHLVKISALIGIASGYEASLFGIVNSDIILSADEHLIPFLIANTRDNTLVYGSRIDVHDIDSRHGKTYALGYDYFFFGNEVLDLNLEGDFFLGKTWWDFWFPVSVALHGGKLRQLLVPIGFHVIHDQAWNYTELESGKNKFMSAIKYRLNSCTISTSITDRIRFIVTTQGMDGLVGQIPSVLILNSELIVYGPQYVSMTDLSPFVDTLRVYQEKYEMLFKSRSWRWTAPFRFLSNRARALLGK